MTPTVPDDPRRILTADQQLGARVAFGPRHAPWCLDRFREAGYRVLFEADDPQRALIGGLMIRVADLEDELSRAEV